MLNQELTIGIYIDGKLDDVLIVPDGHEYHLFLTGSGNSTDNYVKAGNPENIGSIVFINNQWIYEGTRLSQAQQLEIADYIMGY